MSYLHSIYLTNGQGLTADIPKAIRRNLESFADHHEGFEPRLYTMESAASFLESAYPHEVSHAFNTLIPLAYKADLLRYCLLHKLGGIYADLSVNFSKPLLARSDKLHLFRDSYSNAPWIVSTSVLAAPAGLPVFEQCIAKIVEHVQDRYYGPTALCPTGPNLLGREIAKVMDIGDFVCGETVRINKSASHAYAYLDRDGEVVATNVKRGTGLSSLGATHAEDYNAAHKSKRVYKGDSTYAATWKLAELNSNGARSFGASKPSFDPGVALYGPYASIPKGSYLLSYKLKTEDFEVLSRAGYRIDACNDFGAEDLPIGQPTEKCDRDFCVITLPFEAERDLRNLEVRLHVQTAAVFEIEDLSIQEV